MKSFLITLAAMCFGCGLSAAYHLINASTTPTIPPSGPAIEKLAGEGDKETLAEPMGAAPKSHDNRDADLESENRRLRERIERLSASADSAAARLAVERAEAEARIQQLQDNLRVIVRDRDQWQANALEWEVLARQQPRANAAVATREPASIIPTPQPEAYHQPKTKSAVQFYQSTGAGTGVILGADGRPATYIQSTGSGTATIITPRK